MKTQFGLLSLVLIGLFSESGARAADPASVIPFLADDVVAIAYVDLTAIDLAAWQTEFRKLGVLPPGLTDDAAHSVAPAQQLFDDFVRHGASHLYALLRTSDLEYRGPTWVLSLTKDANADALIGLLKGLGEGPQRPAFFPNEIQVVDGSVLAAMNEEQMARMVAEQSGPPREEAVAALEKLGGSNAGLVVLGDADSRRVLREMFPRLQPPLERIDGRMIAEDLLWGGLTLDFLPQPRLAVHVETSSPRIAAELQQAAVQGLAFARELLVPKKSDAPSPSPLPLPAASIQTAFDSLQPKTEGSALRLQLGDDAAALTRLSQLLAPSIVATREAADRNQRLNQFKQLALAFWNYESAHRALVAQAIYDETGKPLLSWRVQLLPYLDEQALYDEFHLEEPWDSPHNRQLIERMPEVFSDPNAELRRALGAGRTTYVAPVAAETLFPPRSALPDGEPLRIRDVTDGTSKTILLVEVLPERAVVWTKPEDWQVNLDRPREGVVRPDRTGFVAAFCDGSVRFLPNEVDAMVLRAIDPRRRRGSGLIRRKWRRACPSFRAVARRRSARYARIGPITCPCTSVSRLSIPLCRNVRRRWSIPIKCRIVAWRS